MSRSPRAFRAAVVLTALVAGLGSGAAETRTGPLEGPLRPKAAAKPASGRAETPRRTGAWTRAPDGRATWRDGDTSVTVSGTVTVETGVGNRR